MMKSKPRKLKKKNGHRFFDFSLQVLLTLIILSGLAAIVVVILPPKIQVGRLGQSEAHAGEAVQHSLDLGIAAQGQYPSSALTVVRDLGTEDGLKRQVVSFDVKVDGISEFAILEEPTSPPPANGFPAIILCHGYVNPASYLSLLAYQEDMDFYAKHGFAVIKPDFRGQGLSVGHGEPTSAYYSMDYNIDLMSLISALKDTKDIDKSNLNLWGHSMGAYIALRAATMSRDIKNTILLSTPGGSLRDIYLSYVPPSDENNLPALKARSDVFSKYGTPAENPGFWQKASASDYLERMVSRVQIHVGAADTIVPTQLSADLDTALTQARKTHQYFIYDGADHGLGPQRSLIWSRSLKFLSGSS